MCIKTLCKCMNSSALFVKNRLKIGMFCENFMTGVLKSFTNIEKLCSKTPSF